MFLNPESPVRGADISSAQVTLGYIDVYFPCLQQSNSSLQQSGSDVEEEHDRKSAKCVCVRALPIKCSHRRAGEGLQSNVKITYGDLLSLRAAVRLHVCTGKALNARVPAFV